MHKLKYFYFYAPHRSDEINNQLETWVQDTNPIIENILQLNKKGSDNLLILVVYREHVGNLTFN